MNDDQAAEAMRRALLPFERGAAGENPYAIQSDLQQMMQDLVGIVRREEDMRRALEQLAALNGRAGRVGVGGHREYNPGWHTALDLGNLLTVSEAVTRAALLRKESRGAHFREDAPGKVEALGKVNHVVRRGPDGTMQVAALPLPPLREDLAQVVKEMG